MEQMIYIKYITNLYNLDCYSEDISRNIGNNSVKILHLEILKNKLAILLCTNEILIFDTKSEKFMKRKFNKEEEESNEESCIYINENRIRFMKVFFDQIWIICGTFLKLLDSNNLNVIKSFDLNEKFYSFCFFSEFNNFNLEIVYVNDLNEVKFFSKSLLFDGKYKNLYKENSKIDKMNYQCGLLIWSSKLTIKVFDLEKKKMILRKSYENEVSSTESSEDIIDFILFENYLCVNAGKKIVFVYSLPICNVNRHGLIDNSNSNKDISSQNTGNNSKLLPNTQPIEIFRSEGADSTMILGFWLNSSLTKISIIKSEHSHSSSYSSDIPESSSNNKQTYKYCRDACAELKHVSLTIYKFNDTHKTLLHSTINSSNSSTSLHHHGGIILKKDFPHICSYSALTFSFSQKYSTVYIYDSNEVYYITLYDKHTKIIEDLKENNNISTHFNDIFVLFDKVPNINEKCFIVNKIIRNLPVLIANKSIDLSKLIHMINTLITSNEKVLNQTIVLLLETNNFEICYKSMSQSIKSKWNKELKEKIMIYFLDAKNYRLMASFILDQSELEISESFLKKIQKVIQFFPNEELYYVYSVLNSKIKNYEKAIEFFLKIEKIDQIFEIMITNRESVDLVFRHEKLFELFNVDQLIEIFEIMYEKEKIGRVEKFKMCEAFYKHFLIPENQNSFEGCLAIENKISQFFSRIIEKEKFEFLITQEISEFCFDILLKESLKKMKNNQNLKDNHAPDQTQNPYYESLLKLVHNLDKVDFKQILLKNQEILNLSEMLDLQILILHKAENYEKIIELYIDRLRNPEKTIPLLENLWNLSDIRKEELLEFLKVKIKDSNYLTSAKKFYFINLFQDNVSSEHQEIILLEELTQSENEEDVKFILLILEQLRLKINILKISCHISKKNLEKIIREMKSEARKGRFLSLSRLMNCSFKACDCAKFKKGDEIICFSNCLHLYHKYCFMLMSNIRRISDCSEKEGDSESKLQKDGNKINLFKVNNRCGVCAKVSID